jgi:hypothetical protein
MDVQILPILVFMAICLYAVALTINDNNKRK